ncbi:MAG: alpha-glucan family phosphorylase [Syntrophales bacterium]|nr:alpha-glucan family phosphorylase [Syntrophales bacterium]MDD5640601.1 alpha-glucan family phosphorylase [Syntrophales bacterium]
MDDLQDRFPPLPERIAGLGELAYNLWWSWHPEARMLFKLLDRGAWKATGHNPVKLLRVLPSKSLEAAAADPEYLRQYDAVLANFRTQIQNQVCWFTENIIPGECQPIAYFSLEYGLHHSLPFYAGGLGFLAGDHLKECSDLGIPMVAVGFMYPDGYVRQKINAEGWQEGVDEVLDRDAAPITRVLNDQGAQLTVQVPFTDPPIFVAVWQVMVGRIPLYLMDTDLEMNDPAHRRISNHLYISDREQRLLQEIVLGIGGSKMLVSMGIKHSVLHMNEGHPALALLERVRERVEGGMNFNDALQEVRATSVFTTHTPVPAGHDVFSFDLMDKYICPCYPMLDRDALLRLGISPTDPPNTGFNMTAFALRLSAYHNGVSRRHGEVARSMWQALWPDLPLAQVPIDHITNGVHVPTWMDPKIELRCMECGEPDWLEERDNPEVWEMVDDIPDKEFWELHYRKKIKLINYIREQTRRRWVHEGISLGNVVVGGALLDPSALTLGFARRFATYKRADLIFQDLERLKRLLNDDWRPLQIIFAGKAHPADDPGKKILQKIFNFARDPGLGGRIAFVEDYGEQVAQYLVHGVDIWLNNPQPPLEACGTSGMKASINGVLHLSILDGWWPEGFNGRNGWAFAGAAGEDRDARDAAAIYQILEQQVIPLYYRVNDQGIPEGWVKMMKEAMKSLGAKFSARRMVKEYSRKFYQPALEAAGK